MNIKGGTEYGRQLNNCMSANVRMVLLKRKNMCVNMFHCSLILGFLLKILIVSRA